MELTRIPIRFYSYEEIRTAAKHYSKPIWFARKAVVKHLYQARIKQIDKRISSLFRLPCLQKSFDEFLRNKQVEQLFQERKKINQWLYLIKNPAKKGRGKITEAEIAQAKAYPFENLIDFGRNHKALCPFHEDTVPSLALYKNNCIWCFSCNRGFDTIAYMMERFQLSFVEAVRELNRR